MPFSLKKYGAALLLLFSFFETKASHIVGGEVTYIYKGDSLVSGVFNHIYQVSVTIYEDCIPGEGDPSAIAADNPAFLAVYDGPGLDRLQHADSVNFATATPVPTGFSNECIDNIQPTCLIKKTFIKTYFLPPNATGYIVTYQRCCRNGSVSNIIDPSGTGSTFYGIIPPAPYTNNSAIFRNYPPQIICLNNPLIYDHGATDADGDSLSYEFCTSVTCCLTGGPGNIKPYPPSPPDQPQPYFYDSVSYVGGFTSRSPVASYPQVQIDPATGLITGTPNRTGRYLVTVCCHEWRNGLMINTVKREFQFVVTSCSKKVIADIPQYSTDPNTYIVNCLDYHVHFVNTSNGGFRYHWDFGVAGTDNDTSGSFEPDYTYPDTGTYLVKLIVNPGSTCPDSISRLVKIYPRFRADFIDSGILCPGASIQFKDRSTATIKPITDWKWNFGDGDSSFLQNPMHTYAYGGPFNVMLIARNIKRCVDTILAQVIIDNFSPFAGNDTIIVKGETVQFNATGGIQYRWAPPTNLSDTTIFNPIGRYPDTGQFTYRVYVVSPYGCSGYDTVKVSVVNQAAFFVPSAFTPNGDGVNDYFRPIAIGYRSLKYFRVFNRWGQEVFYTTNLEAGWDGTHDHKRADLGTYYWEISFTDRFGNEAYLKGDVTLIR